MYFSSVVNYFDKTIEVEINFIHQVHKLKIKSFIVGKESRKNSKYRIFSKNKNSYYQ